MEQCWLGIDCGSVSVKGVLLNQHNEVVEHAYLRNRGLTVTVQELLECLDTSWDNDVWGEPPKVAGAGVTGSGREFVGQLLGADLVETEIIAHYIATTTLHPEARTIFDIGGEDCKLMRVDEGGSLCSFQMNRDCGGGTGAMIESIATRLGVALPDIGSTALRSTTHVSIPSKCGIFAQSAVVSKINKGVPASDILMGVCRGLVGNFFTMLAKGTRLQGPYVFQGATARNEALVHCFTEEMGEPVIVPENPHLMGAIGMALMAKEHRLERSAFKGWDIKSHTYETRTLYGNQCSNECEITSIMENGAVIGYVGNRCERCLPKGSER